MRLIDADALPVTKGVFLPKVGGNIICCDEEAVFKDEIDEAPTIEAEPVQHGRWEGTADGYWNGELIYDIWNCSECGREADQDERPTWKYCPYCGAKMDEKEDDIKDE